MKKQEIIDKWNAAADKHNQWDDLSGEEQVDFAIYTLTARVAELEKEREVMRHALNHAKSYTEGTQQQKVFTLSHISAALTQGGSDD